MTKKNQAAGKQANQKTFILALITLQDGIEVELLRSRSVVGERVSLRLREKHAVLKIVEHNPPDLRKDVPQQDCLLGAVRQTDHILLVGREGPGRRTGISGTLP